MNHRSDDRQLREQRREDVFFGFSFGFVLCGALVALKVMFY